MDRSTQLTTALANRQGQLNPLKNVDPKDILERYLAEENSTQIAHSLGVTKAALSFFLLKHAEEEWKSAQVVKAIRRKEDAEAQLETASNALDLARGRELLRAAQWDLERVCRRIYGQDQPPATAAVQVNINLRRNPDTTGAQVIDAQVIASDSTTDEQSVGDKKP